MKHTDKEQTELSEEESRQLRIFEAELTSALIHMAIANETYADVAKRLYEKGYRKINDEESEDK